MGAMGVCTLRPHIHHHAEGQLEGLPQHDRVSAALQTAASQGHRQGEL